ncbi:MAG: uracil-DNA glycosylase family protein [Pseudomonadota bacterium]
MNLETIKQELAICTLCQSRFAQTHTGHVPRPVVWFDRNASILVAGQAPGARVHESGVPFTDPSGDRLRDWLGLDEAAFYDRNKLAILPMGFCFPGYNAKGADLPPPALCAETWRARIMAELPNIKLTLLIGGYAQKWHLGSHVSVTETVANWRAHAPAIFPLPHPSWRNTAWLKRNPWFEAETLPALKRSVQEALNR